MKSNEETYQKLTMREHILKRPGMYIGAIDTINDVLIVKGALQQVSYSPGLLKIFDEAIVNAIDHSNRTEKVTNIRVDIESDKTITITNDGPAIPIEVHKEHQCYIPEMIFTQFLTGSNYDDNQQRTVGGLNGLGIKLTSVFSKKFVIDILSANKHYYQEIYDNLTVINKPIIKNKKGKDYVKISFTPDFSRFPKNSIKDTYSLIESRIYDTCALTDDKVSVFLNGEKLKMKGFSNYLSIFNKKFINETITSGDFSWDIAVSMEPNEGFQQVSFVNGINTYKGGKHVDYIVNQITKSLSTLIETKKKVNIKPAYIKDRLFVIVKAVIVNPSFESQSKEALTTPSTKFGGKYSVSEKFIEKLYKTDIITDVLSFADYKAKKDLNKTTTTNTKKNKIYVKNLDDAIYAGTSKSQKCTLILTEGLSAKTFAVSGTSIIGREYYGIFALKGKALNVREATQNQILKNEEVNNIKKIIGLQHDKVYKDTSALRYGSVMILTDSDDDGKHISGLIMNMFHYWWPELLDIPGFIVSMKTPIIKASNNKEVIDFYSVFDFTEWRKTNNISKYNIKYYKGLGTSTAKEAKDVFKNMSQNVIKYIHKDKDLTNQAILLAFEKKKTDDRKEWLSRYESSLSVEEINNNVSFDDFINKELIHFSMADIHRSIPSMVDGLKPSQRKVLYTLIKKNYSKEIKVAQLGASVAEITSYHHGEASLYSTIINMAQDYVGSNNINLLKPNGQFGCLDPETPILLWSGYITPAKNIKVGDTLIGDDGFPRKVLKTTSGEDQMYRVFLPETNESFVVNKDHILTVFIPVHKEMVLTRLKDRIIGNEKIFTWDNVKHCFDETIVENTQSFISLLRNRNKTFDIRVEDYLSLSKEIKELLFTIKLNKPILWDKSEEAMYLVDPESIFFYIQKDYMNFIPKTYIKASIKNREKLLKSFLCIFKESLYITKSHIRINIKEITSVISSKILDQITFVWQSLGINVKQTNENYFIYTREYYKYIDKTSSLEDTLSLRYFKMEVSSIGKGKFVGWEVDCNKRFILGNFIVTHNSRISNGKDAASPRYIFTEINDITKKIYNNVDNNLLNYLEDEGNVIEPEYYVPIIPMILVNGASGIGTAYSTNIPCYNPKDIIDNMVLFIKNQPLKDLQPWYKGFKGRCIDNILYGVFKVDKNKIVVSELPLTSINDYTDFIENMITEGKMGIKEYLNYSTETTVNITLIFDTVETVQKLIQGDPYRVLKLTKNISINNMHLFDANGRIKKYDTPNDILKDFTKLRLKYNLKRKQYLTSQYNGQISLLKNKIRFIMGIINEDFVIYKKSKKDIINILETLKFEKIEGNYDYLLDMKMTSFSKEKIEELEKKLKNNEQLLLEISNKNEKQILVEDLNNLLN